MIELSSCTCVLVVTRPFRWYHNFLPFNLDLEVWPTFEKLKPWFLFSDGCRLASVIVFWQLFLYILFVILFSEPGSVANLNNPGTNVVNRAHLMWHRPAMPNGNIIAYQMIVTNTDDSTCKEYQICYMRCVSIYFRWLQCSHQSQKKFAVTTSICITGWDQLSVLSVQGSLQQLWQ